jgi:hypothetical protein
VEHEGPIRRHCAASLIPRRPRYQPVHPLAATTVRSFIEFYLTAPSQVTNYDRRVNVLLRNAAGQTQLPFLRDIAPGLAVDATKEGNRARPSGKP